MLVLIFHVGKILQKMFLDYAFFNAKHKLYRFSLDVSLFFVKSSLKRFLNFS